MNGRKARMLRYVAQRIADARGLPDTIHEDTQPRNTNGQPAYQSLNVGLNGDGTPKVVNIPCNQVILGDCKRKVYQSVKKNWKGRTHTFNK